MPANARTSNAGPGWSVGADCVAVLATRSRRRVRIVVATLRLAHDTLSQPVAPGVERRAQTLRFQGIANWIVRTLGRTPLVNRVLGRRLVTVYVVGRKSGRRYTVPVAYTQHDDSLLIGTPFAWGRNLRSGEPVEIRLKGRRQRAAVQVFTDESSVVEHYSLMAPGQPQLRRLQQDRLRRGRQPRSERSAPGLGQRRPAILLTPL